MKALGAEVRHDVTAINDLRAGPHSRADAGVAGLFVSRRGGARPAPLVLHDPVLPAATSLRSLPDNLPDNLPGNLPDNLPDNPFDRATEQAAWVARHLEADCFHFAQPVTGPRRR